MMRWWNDIYSQYHPPPPGGREGGLAGKKRKIADGGE